MTKGITENAIREFIRHHLRIRISASPDQKEICVELLLRPPADVSRLDEFEVIDTDFVYIQTGE